MNISNEEEAVNALKELVSGKMYLLLSTVQANMIRGYSFPYVGQMDAERVIMIFTDEDYAKKYIDRNGYEVLEGLYPIHEINKEDKISGMGALFNIAYHMGINIVDFNPEHPSMAFGCKISWLMEKLEIKNEPISILLNKKEYESILEKEDGKVPLRFNSLAIKDFTNPYVIDDERKEFIAKIPFDNIQDIKQFIGKIGVLSVNELVFLSEIVNRRYVPLAKKENREDDVKYFGELYSAIDFVIFTKISKLRLYTLLDNGEIFINANKAVYLLYTERFKYMGEYRYREITVEELYKYAVDNEIDIIIVTAGPGEMHMTSPEQIKPYFDFK